MWKTDVEEVFEKRDIAGTETLEKVTKEMKNIYKIYTEIQNNNITIIIKCVNVCVCVCKWHERMWT